MPVTPSPNRSRTPTFHELDADSFEEMTCALHEKEPGVKMADLYRTKRKLQHGIDVIAERLDACIEVASCKCCSKITKGEINQWSTDFLEHWDTQWKNKNVRRFILVVATLVNSKERDDDIQEQRKRFQEIGVTYDVWGPRQLQEKLRPYRGIVSQYLGVEWEPRICGHEQERLSTSVQDTGANNQQILAQLEALQSALSEEVDKRLEVAVDVIRRGDLTEVGKELAAVRNGPNWRNLKPVTQARAVRLQGSLALQHGDLTQAQMLSDEADAIAPPDEPRLRALLAARRGRPIDGLRVLGEPVSRDGVQLRVALLLEADDQEKAIDLLNHHPALNEPNAETERLKAFAELLRGQRSDAFAAVQRAEAMEPNWPAIRRAGAIVRYALALSPMATVDWYLGLNPVDLDLVREDDEAQELLQEAFSRFDRLIVEDVNADIRLQDEAWALACMSNLRNRLGEAEDRCRAILARTPTHSLAVIWALARGFEIDRRVSTEALRDLVDRCEADSQQALVLAWLFAADDKIMQARRVLQDTASLFDTPRSQDIRDQWLFDLAARDADTDPAEGSSQGSPSHQLARMLERAHHTNDWTHVDQSFHNLMTAPTPPPYALPTARALASAGRWSAIGSHINALLRFETAEAVRIAIHTVYKTGQMKRVLQIIESYRSVFPNQALPNELRAIEVEALQASGDPASALRRATMLAAESPALEDQMIKAKIHLETGNIRAALPIIRQAVETRVLHPRSALQLAQLVGMEDMDLARRLWRHAKATGIPEDLALTALDQAFRLNVEHEADQLFGVMEKLAHDGSGVVRLVSMDDLVEFLKSGQEDTARLQKLYYDGIVPGHLVAERLNINLGRLYWLSHNGEESAVGGSIIMIRHAARPITNGSVAPISDWRIHLDITALLLASQLELLDQLEQLPNPIAVSSALPVALKQLEIQARPHQPGHVAGMRKVISAISDGTIKVVAIPPRRNFVPDIHDETLEVVQASEITAEETVIVTHHLPNVDVQGNGRFTTLRAIVDGAYMAGALDNATYEEGLVKIGNYAHDSRGVPPPPGTSVLFLGNTFSVFAVAGLLDPVAHVYRVQVEDVMQTMAHDEVAQAERNEAIAAWLGMLRNRVAEGLENGRYTLFSGVPNGAGDEGKDVDDVGPTANGVVQCLNDLVQAPCLPGAVVWADDRHISGYQNNGQGSPLIGVTDVLQALQCAQIITDNRYYSVLLSLRTSGAMFIPIEAEEVFHHLAGAPTLNGVTVETPALATLRRYVARAILLDSHLKIGNSPQGLEGRPDETVYLIGLRNLAERCIIHQWMDDALTDEVRRGRSTWIWSALRVDGLLRQDLAVGEADRNLLLMVLQICGLLTGAIKIVVPQQGMTWQRRKTFFKWVEDDVLGSRLEDDKPLAEQVKQHLVSLLLSHIDNGTEREAHSVKRILRALFAQYPREIHRRLLADAQFCKSLEIPVIAAVTVANRKYNARLLWKAVWKALVYGKSHLRTIKGDRRIIVRAVRGTEYTVRFDGDRTVLTDPAFALLDRSISRRRAEMRRHVDWFDVPTPKREQTIQSVCEIRDPAERIDTLGRLRRRSVDWHYTRVRDHLRMRDEHTFKNFWPPPADALLDHLRLLGDKTELFANRLGTATGALIAEYGCTTAFVRLAGIPVAMSESFLLTLRAMPTTERKSVLNEICSKARTPLRLLHGLFLIHEVAEVDDREIFSTTLDRLLNEWQKSAELFIAVLKWAHSAYTHDASWSQLPATDRLALVWTHADRLTGILLEMAFDTDQVARDFVSNHRQVPIHEILRLDSGYHGAAANPDTMSPECLLFHGLGYVLGDDRADNALSSTQVETLQNLLTIEADGTKVTSPWLFTNRDVANNDLGTFFTRRPDGLLPLDASLTAVSHAMDNVLRNLETDPSSPTAWTNVWALGKPALEHRDRVRLLAVLDNVDLVAFVKRNPEDIYLCRMAVDCWSRLGDSESHAKIAKQLGRLATHLAFLHPGAMPEISTETSTSNAHRDLFQLVEAAAMSARATNETDALTQLGDSLVSLAAAWPNAAPLFRQILNNICSQATVQHSKMVWKQLLMLRAYR